MIVCRQCGHEGPDGIDFCESCGAFLEWEGERLGDSRDPGGGAAAPVAPAAGAPGAGRSAPPPPDGGVPADGVPAGGWREVAASSGHDEDTVICLECGARNAADRRFCRRCGATLDLVALSGRPPRPQAERPGRSAMPEPAPGSTIPAPPASPGAPPHDPARGRRGSTPVPQPAAPAPGRGGAPPASPGPPPGAPAPGRSGEGPAPPLPASTAGPAGGASGAAPTDPGGITAGGLVARPPSAPVPAPPRVEARPPAPMPGVAPAPARGMQPAEPKVRPAPARPRPAEPDVPPGGPTCADCGTANPPGRRFCRRCGAGLPAGAAQTSVVPAAAGPRRSWWRRLVDRVTRRGGRDRDVEGADRPGTRAGRGARAAYRRSLDVRFRVLRVLAVVAGLGVLAGGLGLVGLNPISGARGLWDRAFPRYERIGELRATVEPEGTIEADFPPGAAVDGDPSSAWATTWLLEPGAPAADGCDGSGDEGAGGDEGADEDGAAGEGADLQGGAAAGLTMSLPAPTEVTKIEVAPGLEAGDPARAGQWQPTLLEVRFDDGTCTTVELDDSAGFQDHRLDGPRTTTVRLRVLDAAPPTDPAASRGLVAVGEVRLYQPG